MHTALIAADSESALAGLENDLKRVGVHVLGTASCEELVRQTVQRNPEVVVARIAVPGSEWFAAFGALEAAFPVATVVFTDDTRAESVPRALAGGVHVWVVRGYGPERLRPSIQLALARFEREREQCRKIRDLTQRLEERILVDRAKGILMSHGGMEEADAFRMLREAAMHGKRRLGQVAQRLIDAARNAESINRAGQLRMLSQRLVKLHLLMRLEVEPASARALRQASIDRISQNFAALAHWTSAATFGDLQEEAVVAWHALERAIDADAPQDVSTIDAAAERLLDAAERWTTALEASSPMEDMRIVNLAGRQRMLTQRMAKISLLRALAPASESAQMPEDADERARLARMDAVRAAFEEAMSILRRSTATTTAGHTALDQASRCWERLWQSAQRPLSMPAQWQIAQASEELLDLFDGLTDRYERNLRVLAG